MALNARYAIVEFAAMNFAGSRIKRGSCWTCFSGWHGGICVHYSYNSRTIFQLIQSIAWVYWR